MASRTSRPDDITQGTPGRTVVGLFPNRSDAQDAIRDLKDAGFTEREIGVALRDRDEQQELMEDTSSAAAEGAKLGAVSGGLVGGLIGLLGSLLIPGVGPIVAGGVLASVLAGAGIGAATGGIIGALMGLGVPEADARHFDHGLRSGGVLVTVDAAERVAEVLDILERHDVDLGPSNAERFRTGTTDDAYAGGGVLGDTREFRAPVGTRTMRDPQKASSARRYEGNERRRRQDTSYAGPERRELFL